MCAEGAKTSLSAADLPAAARHIATYRALPDPVRADAGSAAAVSQIDQSIAELSRKVRAQATDVLAGEHVSLDTIMDAVRLFVPIGLTEEGMTELTTYLQTRIKRESDADVRSLLLDASDANAVGVDEPHIVALSRLFECVAAFLHDCQPHLLLLFDVMSIATVVEAVQEQCDTCAERILNRYKEARRVEEVLRALRSETANARDLDALLNELTLLSQRMSGYFNYLKQRTDVEELEEHDTSALKRSIETVVKNSKLEKLRLQLGGYYTSIEAYFMIENARLAIKIDESNGEEAETSTAVDDFFFVMQKCFQRAFAFGDTEPDVLHVVLQQISLCLMNDLLSYMRRRLRETEAALEKLFGGTASLPAASLTVSYLTELAKANISIPGGNKEQSENADIAKYDFFIALNNASVSAEYATRLRSNVEKALHASPKLSADDHTLLAAPIAQITDAVRSLAHAAEHGVSRLASVLLERVTPAVEEALKTSAYFVSEKEYSLDSDATPAFSREVAQELETKVLSASLEKRLTEKNWDALVRAVAEWFAQKIESVVFLTGGDGGGLKAKKFNAFGGLRADRDVRAISAYFSEKSRRSTVRDVFGRLSQFAMVVNLERPAEIYDIWGPNAGGMTWRLTSTEVRRTLSLRKDFNQEAIRCLKL